MIRIGADCKLSAKPPLIGLKSDHCDAVRRQVGCIYRFCASGEERRAAGVHRAGVGAIEGRAHVPQNELHGRGSVARQRFSLSLSCNRNALSASHRFCLYYKITLSRRVSRHPGPRNSGIFPSTLEGHATASVPAAVISA